MALAVGTLGSIFVGILTVLVVFWKIWKSQIVVDFLLSRAGKLLPPVQGGPIPWLGCAINFGKEPLSFINWAHQKVRSLKFLFNKSYFILVFSMAVFLQSK